MPKQFTTLYTKQKNWKSKIKTNPKKKRYSSKNNRSVSVADQLSSIKFVASCSKNHNNFVPLVHVASCEKKENLESATHGIDDPIYGHVHLSEKSRVIVNSPEFQRLQQIHQLGTTWLVYPTAKHKRYEHSIGVAHWAKTIGECLLVNQPELHLTENHIVWLELAGLCHDLGHGPFSHTFDNAFCATHNDNLHKRPMLDILPEKKLQGKENPSAIPRHEKRSQLLTTALFTKYHTWFDSDDIAWVTWLIEPKDAAPPDKRYEFLGEIICNAYHGIDVDRMEYLLRDAYYLGCIDSIWWDTWDLLNSSRIVDHRWTFEIQFKETIKAISETRQHFHQKYYNHPENVCLEYMVHDILLIADQFLDISRSISQPKLFWHLTDNVIQDICNYQGDSNKYVDLAKTLCQRVMDRDMWYVYRGITCREPCEQDCQPEFLVYHDVQFISWSEAQDKKFVLVPWTIFTSPHAPHNCLPKVLYFDRDSGAIIPNTNDDSQFCQQSKIVYYHVLEVK